MRSTQAGAVIAGSIAKYKPFGEYRAAPTTGDIGFTGHRHNDESGLIYMNARYYLPSAGRFVSADSLVPSPGNPQSLNRYSYVYNNPINATDPTGHFITSLIGGIVGGAFTGITYALTTDNWNLTDQRLVSATGFVGGALIGSGVGATAGATIMSTTLAANTAVAIGAGTGIIAASEVYMSTSDTFDRSDYMITAISGGIDGGLAASPILGGTGIISVGRRVISSSLITGASTIGQNIANGDTPNLQEIGYNMGISALSVGLFEGFSGGFNAPDWREINRAVPWQRTIRLDPKINSRDIYSAIRSNFRTIARSTVVNIVYGRITSEIDSRYLKPVIQ